MTCYSGKACDHIVERNYAVIDSNRLDNVVNMFRAMDDEEHKSFTFATTSAIYAAQRG